MIRKMIEETVAGVFAIAASVALAVVLFLAVSEAKGETLQEQLDANGFLRFPAGKVQVTEKLIVRNGQRAIGEGVATTLEWKGEGAYALRVEAKYLAEVKDFVLVGGGVELPYLVQTNEIESVRVFNAREDAFHLENPQGERQVLLKCLAWESKRHGLYLTANEAKDTGTNGLTLEKCNLQNNGGFGAFLETTEKNGEVLDTCFERCTIQGNKAGGVKIVGYVNGTRFRDTWIEEPGRVGVVIAGKQLGDALRRPLNTLFEGRTVISECSPGVISESGGPVVIDELCLFGKTCTYETTGDKLFPPTGAMRRVDKGKVK